MQKRGLKTGKKFRGNSSWTRSVLTCSSFALREDEEGERREGKKLKIKKLRLEYAVETKKKGRKGGEEGARQRRRITSILVS